VVVKASIPLKDGAVVKTDALTLKLPKGETLTVVDESGTEIPVAISGSTVTTSPLAPSHTYTIKAVLGDSEKTVTVHTGKADSTVKGHLFPSKGTYGVGMPLTITFNHAVVNKEAVASSIKLTSSKPVVGAWAFTDSKHLTFRPQTYWPANTKVTVSANLKDVNFGKGAWGASNIQGNVTIGRAWVLKVNAKTHSSVLYQDGKVIRKMPVSTGKPGDETRSGIKVIMEKYLVHEMTNRGTASAAQGVYDIQVPYSMRMTITGEFLHAAPWNPNIGSANTSHGCTNLKPSDAKWVYQRVLEGDVVETTGTTPKMETWNGIGGAWAYPWSSWVKKAPMGKVTY
jgi:lipoprotein-anchoring transpeptidase ErfK/SrfK